MKVVLASKNPHKLVEISKITEKFGFDLVLQSELGVDIDVEETGTTFEENSLLKAEAVMKATGLPALDVTGCPALAEAVGNGAQDAPWRERGHRWFYIEDPEGEDAVDSYEDIFFSSLLICDTATTVTAGDLVIPGEDAPVPPAVEVKLSADGTTAQITGDFAGLFARAALLLDMDGTSGLLVAQATVNDNGVILLPQFAVPGMTVTGVSIALVPSAADAASPAPRVIASDFLYL